MSVLNSPVTVLHGIGTARAEAFATLGIRKVGDLLSHYPRSYENRGDIRPLADAIPLEKQAFLLTVATMPKLARIRRGMSILKFRAFDASASCEVVYFNQDYLRDAFEVGKEYRFYGKPERNGQKITLSSPAHEEVSENKPLVPLFPIYPSCAGLTQTQIKSGVREALRAASVDLCDHLPEPIRLKNQLPALFTALRGIHTPDSYEEIVAAKRRLVYDELFLFALALRTSSSRTCETGAPICRNNDLAPFLRLLPYTLTGAQARAISEISADMAKETPMNRILIGDVGCGKTVCAAAAIAIAAQNGLQSALMVPTEILARQHFADLEPLLGRLGIRTVLLLGALTEKQKRQTREQLRTHEADLVIGTQALLTGTVEFAALGLGIVDEQHRFGVDQRAWLTEKGAHVHTLVMSATPIPRTLALTVYGGLSMSKIDEMPPGRQTVDTYFVGENYRERIDAFICKLVAEGGRVYIVCPAVEETDGDEEGDLLLGDIGDGNAPHEEKPPLKSAVEYTKSLSEKLPGLRISFVHGKMKSAEKDKVMRDFAEGKIDVLVSTTVIEVGVNVPEACLMIVENADRFGLSQLHQLRGRVGRGTRKSYCILVSDTRGPLARERLATMCRTHDGFEIAETDLRLRGPGDFLRSRADTVIRQSGGTDFHIADLCLDNKILETAFADADSLLASHPLSDYPTLEAKVREIWTDHTAKLN